MEDFDIDMDDVFTPADDMGEVATSVAPLHSVRRELLESRVKDFHTSLGQPTPEVLDHTDYDMDNKDNLYAVTDTGQKVLLTKKNNPHQFLAKNTLKQRLSVAMQRKLGISDALTTNRLPTQAVAQLQNAEQNLPTNIESLPLEDLAQSANTTTETILELETSFTQADEDTALKTINDQPLPMREIMGLNQALQSIRGELINNLAKLGNLDSRIELEKKKLAEADDANLDQEVKERITQRLKNLQDERQARLEVLNNNRQQLQSQVSRIKETIHRILYENSTLAERFRTLFREQGITLVSIITALGFAISTLVYALTGSTLPPPPPPPSAPTGTGWVRKQLGHLAELLKKLAYKVGDALPGITGSVVSWLLSTAGKVVGFMADHLWALLVLVVGFLLSKIKISKAA